MIDSGKILLQKDIEIDPMLHYPQLAMQLAVEGGMAMMDTIYNIDTIKAQAQVHTNNFQLYSRIIPL